MRNIKEVPILFSTPMVQAILDGRKTQTRRIAKLPDGTVKCWHDGGEWIVENDLGNCWQEPLKPKCEVGDLLWVRETTGIDPNGHLPGHTKVLYKASFNGDPDYPVKWKPSIHMPKAACRIWLRCTGVRAERVQNITECDAIAEGVERIKPDGMLAFKSYAVDYPATVFPYSSFKTLWQKINGPESWDANVWVWVYSFEVISTTGKPTNG